MKTLILISLSMMLGLFLSIIAGCKKSPTEPPNTPAKDTVGVYEPNIYLYPQTKSTLSVKLVFPLGGSIVQSEPPYMNGWRVEVDSSGKIDQQYDYLIYEAHTPDEYQYNSGWVVSRDTLVSFFRNNLLKIGFSEQEETDFISYWIPRLSDHTFYFIYPQFAGDIQKVIQLNVSPVPDNILRLFYVIKGSESNEAQLMTPSIPIFKRNGFVVAEWGVVLK